MLTLSAKSYIMARYHQMPKCLHPWRRVGGPHHSADVTDDLKVLTRCCPLEMSHLVRLSWSWELVFFLFPSPFPSQLSCFPLPFCCLELSGVAHSIRAAPSMPPVPHATPTASDEPAEPAVPNKSYVFLSPDPFASYFFISY